MPSGRGSFVIAEDNRSRSTDTAFYRIVNSRGRIGFLFYREIIFHSNQVIKENLVGMKNVLLLTTGSLVGEALKAQDILKQKSMGSIVVNLNCLNKINMTTLASLLKKCEGRIVTIEDHQVKLGLGSFVAHQLALHGEFFSMQSQGVHNEFGQSAYNAIELYRKHGVDSETVAATAQKMFSC